MGATMYFCLTGKSPFEGKSPGTILNNVIESHLLPPSAISSSIPEDLESIVLKCMNKDPGLRYRSAQELKSDLKNFLKGDVVAAHAGSFYYRLSKQLKKRKWAAVIMLALTLIAVPFAVYAWRIGIKHGEAGFQETWGRALLNQSFRVKSSLYI